MKTQFGIRSIFALIAMFAAICATFSWLMSDSGYDTFSKIPPLFLPDITLMGVGISLMPFFCLPVLLGMIVFVVRSKPRPFTVVHFFGIQFAVFVTDISFWGNGMRFIFMMLVSSIALNAEVVCRNLPRGQRVAGMASLLVTGAWYIATVCVCASASV